jgi:hypothetical protein
VIDTACASPLGELFRLGNLVNYKRGQQLGQGPLHKGLALTLMNPSCSVAAFVVNSEPHTGERSSVRLCVGPELARYVHTNLSGTEANAAGRSIRACVARESKREKS